MLPISDSSENIENHSANASIASTFIKAIAFFINDILNPTIKLVPSFIIRANINISRFCPPIAYFLYALAELVKGLQDFILLCVRPHFTKDNSENLLVGERILRGFTSLCIAGLYIGTAVLFLHLNPIGWILATMGTFIGWIKNDYNQDSHYSGFLIFVGMIFFAVNAFVSSPILFPSLGLYSIAAAGYACMIPSFLHGVASLMKAIYSLGEKLCECFCSPASGSENRRKEAASERLSASPSSLETHPGSSSDKTYYPKMFAFIGNPKLNTRKPDETHRLGWKIPVIF